MGSKIVVVGTANPLKIGAVRRAYDAVFPDEAWEVRHRKVDSGVPSQPLSADETRQGAMNRARRALELTPEADHGIGLEAGLRQEAGRWFDVGVVVIRDRFAVEGVGLAAGIEIGPKIMQRVLAGRETLEAIDDELGTQTVSSRECLDILTGGATDMVTYYSHAAICALTRFVRPDLFES